MILVSPLDDLVVDIGNIAHIGHVIAEMAQITGDDIEDHHHPGMADMTEVIDRHTTDIHADLIALPGFEFRLFPRQAIVYL